MSNIEYRCKLIKIQESITRFAYGFGVIEDDAKEQLQETFLKN